MKKMKLGPVYGYLEENGSDILIIAFQSAGRIKPEEMPSILAGKISQQEVAEKHESLNWRKLNQNLDIDNTDILFITDHLSSSYGWYVMNQGKFVHDEINASLDLFLSKRDYRRVVTFGSSKGGTAACMFNLMNRFVTDSLSLVPQINIGQYWKKYYRESIDLIAGEREHSLVLKELNQVMGSLVTRTDTTGKRFVFYTGTHDDQFKEISLFHEELLSRGVDSELFVNASIQRHTPLVTENLGSLYCMLTSIIQNSPIILSRKVHQVSRKVSFLY